MLDRFQNHFLLNKPLLWNTRFVFAVLIAFFINLFFFCAGYFFIYPDFDSLYYYSSQSGLFYFASVIVSILSFIFWMIRYSRNNAFKVFYPKSSTMVYLEWVVIFLIVTMMVAYPFSLQKGIEYKTRSFASETEMLEAVETLNQVHILIPQNKTEYFKEYPDGYFDNKNINTNTIENDSVLEEIIPHIPDYKTIDEKVDEAMNSPKIFEDYPDFLHLSLLNYHRYSNFYIPASYDLDIKNIDHVIKLLIEQDRYEIELLMDSFLELQNKHKLSTNLTKDKWIGLVYNPANYPVGDFNRIYRYNPDEPHFYYYTDSYAEENQEDDPYYTEYAKLWRAYGKIMESHLEKEDDRISLFILISFSMGISLMAFSFRITSGKSWLTALISIGVILIIFMFITFITEAMVDGKLALIAFLLLTLLLFIGEIVFLLRNIYKINGNKRNTSVILNHLIWYIPAVPALIIILIHTISKDNCSYDDTDCLYKWIDDRWWPIIWGNVLMVFFWMWLYVRFIILKWKGVPEE